MTVYCGCVVVMKVWCEVWQIHSRPFVDLALIVSSSRQTSCWFVSTNLSTPMLTWIPANEKVRHLFILSENPHYFLQETKKCMSCAPQCTQWVGLVSSLPQDLELWFRFWPRVTFPASKHHHILAGTKLYCSATLYVYVWMTCLGSLHDSRQTAIMWMWTALCHIILNFIGIEFCRLNTAVSQH